MRRMIAMAIVLAVPTVFLARVGVQAMTRRGEHRGMAALQQTLIPVEDSVPLQVPRLVEPNGASFGPERFRGRWSVIAFGFTSCPDVCPMTLQAMSGAALDSASGVAAGTTQLVFVSVDPDGDTPERVKNYLLPFDHRIVGLTGKRDSIARFTAAVGASYEKTGSKVDHSTSLFVIDPSGRRAGILLRPSDATRIVADLKKLRASHVVR